jgi:hypothetical protein
LRLGYTDVTANCRMIETSATHGHKSGWCRGLRRAVETRQTLFCTRVGTLALADTYLRLDFGTSLQTHLLDHDNERIIGCSSRV